jgi:plasmid maintenance system antidote protein VapI
MKPKPKIYITHPDPSIEEIAKRVGVSKRRMNELIALAAEINKSMAPRSTKSNGKPRARKHPARTANR